MTFTFKFLATNGTVLRTALVGSEDGKQNRLLHGFPDAWIGLEAQIEHCSRWDDDGA